MPVHTTDNLQGLTQQEVLKRRAAGQGNNVALPSSRSYWQIFQENLFTFINAVFFAISAVMAILQRYGDAILVVVVIFSGIVMNIAQEIWAKRKLDQIALLNRPTASVIREGREEHIDPGDIVLGDILWVRSGDQILVDGILVGDGRIDVDESLLTGESDTVPKLPGDAVYSGTFCVSGSGHFESTKVGAETIAFKLVTGARAFRQVNTPLQQEINLVIRIFLLLACFLWILVAISLLSRSLPLTDIVQRAAVIAGLVPAGLLVAITLSYGTGAVRMLGENILIQQANAVESLSNVDILCLDKTGTLTTNQLQLHSIHPVEISELDLQQRLGHVGANTANPNRTTEAIAHAFPGTAYAVKAEVPFSSARQWSAITLKDNSVPGTYVLGAPEVLTRTFSPSSEITDSIQAGVEAGLRVLLFAYTSDLDALDHAIDTPPTLPDALLPLGVLQFSDQLRPQAQETLDGFATAGIRVKIISGDNPQTVAALARQAGLGPEVRLVSGPELALMDTPQFVQAVSTCNVFGRITPEQKARLVQTMRHQGHYVAMIGDGVNDVLSLKQANLGIAMESGSKAARGVADIVLLQDSFAALPHTFLEGQRIRNGIRDALALFIVRVFCITLLIVAAAMVTDSFPLVNKHSALVSLFGVGLPTAVLPIWAKPGGVTRRSMVRSLLHFTIPAAISITLVALLIYLLYLLGAILDLPPGSDFTQVNYTQPRTALVTILILCQLLLLPFLKPPTTAWVGGEPLSGDWRYSLMAVVLLIGYLLILVFPLSRRFFELSSLSPLNCLFLGLVAIEWALILRAIWRSRFLDRFLGVDLS